MEKSQPNGHGSHPANGGNSMGNGNSHANGSKGGHGWFCSCSWCVQGVS